MTYLDFGIELKTNQNTGEISCVCPKCSEDRKKKNIKCLSVNLDKKCWNCHHCGWTGGLPTERPIQERKYTKPVWKNNTKLSDKAVKWFESRGINQETLEYFKISEGLEYMPQHGKEMNTIQFNYFLAGELINIKYRTGSKDFKLYKDAELILYNADAILTATELILVEGEIDCLTLHQSGLKNVVSVPNGANLNKNNLQYLDSVSDILDRMTKIYIATDNDIAGRNLRHELANRIGIHKCFYIEFKDCKDANECYLKHGPLGIKESYEQAKPFPIEGIFTIEDYQDEVLDLYENGLDTGCKLKMPEIDDHISFVKGYLSVITGIPSHGKTSFLNEIIIRLSLFHGWKCAFYSPESKPTKLHISKLIRLLIGKHWDGPNRITREERDTAMAFLQNHILFVKPEKNYTLDSILDKVRLQILQRGLDCFVVDAWNRLEHKDSSNMSKYIGDSLNKISDFCEKYNVHGFIVAHPAKMRKQKDSMKYEIPTLYDISDSANFYNKADIGISVYRDFETDIVTIMVQKVKFEHWGKVDGIQTNYHLPSGRYTSVNALQDTRNWLIPHEPGGKIIPSYYEPAEYRQPIGEDSDETPPF